jgi:hypothetical protein
MGDAADSTWIMCPGSRSVDASADGAGIIGGIVLSTLVTLILVPVFYMLVERMRAASGKVLTVPDDEEGHAQKHL